MPRKSCQINLFEYLDYRAFLRDWYTFKKKERGSYSFRIFSRRGGFGSPNFLKLVMDGDRNLTEDSLSKFVIGLDLNKQEREFFRNLVFFNQATTHDRKNYYYQQILGSRKFNELKPIEKDQYEYYSTWYHPVIRELVATKDFDGTPEWLVERIRPNITVAQAKKSLEILEKLGFIKRISACRFKQTTNLVTTGAESGSLTLLNYHQNLLSLEKELLSKILPAYRDVSALTLGISKKKIPEIKRRIQDFRKELLELVSLEENPETVVLLAMQFMPLTKMEEEKKA